MAVGEPLGVLGGWKDCGAELQSKLLHLTFLGTRFGRDLFHC